MLNFQCRQTNRTTMARTLYLALLLGHPILCVTVSKGLCIGICIAPIVGELKISQIALYGKHKEAMSWKTEVIMWVNPLHTDSHLNYTQHFSFFFGQKTVHVH